MTPDSATLTDIAVRLNMDHLQNNDSERQKILPSGFFITDQMAAPEPERIIASLPKGFGVILRDYDHPARERLANSLGALCRNKGIFFLVARDADLAARVRADGIHLPEAMMAQSVPLHSHHPDWMITTACHDLTALHRANELPVDALLISPVFPTLSHPETRRGERTTLGQQGVLNMVGKSSRPLYGLGGITAQNARQLIGSGLAGIAAIRGFCVAKTGST